MSAVERQPKLKTMPFAVRPLAERDIAQCAEIERDAFPTLFPPTSFRREMKSPIVGYLVAWQRGEDVYQSECHSTYGPETLRNADSRPIISRLFNGARSLWSRQYQAWQPGQDLIAGFAGTWYMADEAHIVSVGVRSSHRGRGIGELLLISAIEHAMLRQARVVTLEVRVSNYIAKNLYSKYGFTERGIRKAYYTDDREDANIMTTSPIGMHPYPERFRKLVEAHERSWGYGERVVT